MSAPRTQAERREAMTRRLLDAARDVLVEHGYSQATVQRICDTADVSQGALFRYYPTREALMVAVGKDVGEALLRDYRDKLAALDTGDAQQRIRTGLQLVAQTCRARTNMAWHELMMAARTSDALRTALLPFEQAYRRDIEDIARELFPDLANNLGEHAGHVIGGVIAMFDGAVLHSHITGLDAEAEHRRIALLEVMLGAITGLPTSG